MTKPVKRADQVMPVPTDEERRAVWAAIPCAPGWAMPHEIARASGTSWLITLLVLEIYQAHIRCVFADETCSFSRYQRATNPVPATKETPDR
ncbi:MAG: hypothetical protein IT338_17680 [Thermomicrobiales bacterium]|nr:hypothetical protein [Thermomicrobiales bacterium]